MQFLTRHQPARDQGIGQALLVEGNNFGFEWLRHRRGHRGEGKYGSVYPKSIVAELKLS
jgi:hypothetical protein